MTRFLLVISYLVFTYSIQAQDLHIYYDAATDSIRYVESGTEIKSPALKKGKRVALHVINYNDYLYDLSIKLEEKEIKIPSNGIGKIIDPSGSNQALKGLMSSASGLDGDGIDQDGLEWAKDAQEGGGLSYGSESTKEQLSQDYINAVTKYSSTLERMQSKEADIVAQSSKIREKLNVFKVKQFMGQELAELKYNPHLNPEQIKRISLEYLEKVFEVDRPEDLTLDAIIEKSDVQKNMNREIKLYRSQINNLNRLLLMLEIAKDTLLKYEGMEQSARISIVTSYEKARERTVAYQEKALELETKSADLEDWNLQELMSVRYIYEEVKNHPFTYNYVFTPRSDELELSIELSPNEVAKEKGIEGRELPALDFAVYGGIKVNASVGISFGGFFDRPQTYFSREDEIRADDGDLFQPIVTSFIHFYRQGQSAVSLGGSFGLGISIGGENSGGQTYFLGPSLILGREQRVVITTGLMGGKVSRLAQDYSLGDTFTESIVPTRSVYNLGYFLGFSFNL